VDSKIGRLNNFIKHVKVPIQVVHSADLFYYFCSFDRISVDIYYPYETQDLVSLR